MISTIFERSFSSKVVVAKSLTISCLTNYAAGISATPLTHEEVVSNANRFDSQFSALLEQVILKISELS